MSGTQGLAARGKREGGTFDSKGEKEERTHFYRGVVLPLDYLRGSCLYSGTSSRGRGRHLRYLYVVRNSFGKGGRERIQVNRRPSKS